jgi:hypothetical protein
VCVNISTALAVTGALLLLSDAYKRKFPHKEGIFLFQKKIESPEKRKIGKKKLQRKKRY